MMSADGWLDPDTFPEKFRNFQKRLDRIERGSLVNESLFTGMTDRALKINDWNSDEARFNGFYYTEVGAENVPDPLREVMWVGYTISLDDNNGFQQVFLAEPPEGEPVPVVPGEATVDPANPLPTDVDPEPDPPDEGKPTLVRQYNRFYSTNENNFTAYTEWEPSGGGAGGRLEDLADVKIFKPQRPKDLLMWDESYDNGRGSWVNVSYIPGVSAINQSLEDLYDETQELAQAALEAQNTATIAQQTADGKSEVTYSVNPPGDAPNTAGDIWFVKDGTSAGSIIAQYEGLGGNSWASRALSNAVIANLDAGKITGSFISTSGLQVLTNFTLGSAGSDGVIQSYGYSTGGDGVFINKNSVVVRGGTIGGTNITGGSMEATLIRTASSGLRWEMSNPSLGATLIAARSEEPNWDFSNGGAAGGVGVGFLNDFSANGAFTTPNRTANLLIVTPRYGSDNTQRPTIGMYQSRNTSTGVITGLIEMGPSVSVYGTLRADYLRQMVDQTTTALANCYISPTGFISRSTSSRRFKEDIQPLELDVETVLALEPKSYGSLIDETDDRFVGFIAEEAEALGLDAWIGRDAEGQVDSFAYTAWVVAQQYVLRDQADRIKSLESQVEWLSESLAEMLPPRR